VIYMGSFLVVKAKIKEIAQGFNVAGDVADVLEKKVTNLIKEACDRAKANGRKTLMGKDF
jgi:histone H3/H4